jgi:hypothetical protein
MFQGNEIIAKLQGEVKDLKSKLKVRNMVTMKQEEVINEKVNHRGSLIYVSSRDILLMSL